MGIIHVCLDIDRVAISLYKRFYKHSDKFFYAQTANDLAEFKGKWSLKSESVSHKIKTANEGYYLERLREIGVNEGY